MPAFDRVTLAYRVHDAETADAVVTVTQVWIVSRTQDGR
jgi:hypothetical protein